MARAKTASAGRERRAVRRAGRTELKCCERGRGGKEQRRARSDGLRRAQWSRSTARRWAAETE